VTRAIMVITVSMDAASIMEVTPIANAAYTMDIEMQIGNDP